MALYPTLYEGTRAVEILDAEGCEVHMVPLDKPDRELVKPCSTWFVPQPGVYRYWLEREWEITPYSGRVSYSASAFDGHGMSSGLPLGPAGRVVLPEDLDARGDQMRLLHAGPHTHADLLRQELTRRIARDAVGEGVRMPAGPTIAALWDRQAGRYVQLSRPFDLGHRETMPAPLAPPPPDRAHLVVQILRETSAPRPEDASVGVHLVRGGELLEPDMALFLLRRVYALWYDVGPGPARLEAGDRKTVIEPVTLELTAGTIEHTLVELLPRPAIDAEIELPASLRSDEETLLQIRSWPEGEPVEERALEPGEWHRTERFESLPRTSLEVRLVTRLGTVSDVVDLTDGVDAFVHLAPTLTMLTGRVILGDDPHAATLRFTTVDRHTLAVESDAEGAYEATVLAPVRSVEVELSEVGVAPFVEFFPAALEGTVERDFGIPDNRFSVRVVDAVSGQGIADATVTSRNRYLIDAALDPDADMAVLQQAITDDGGAAHLPPLRAGDLEVDAVAEGYVRLLEPVTIPVADGDQGTEILVTLEPLGASVDLHLELANGTPAAGAAVVWVGSLERGNILFETLTGADGLASLPRRPGGFMLVRHDQAGFRVEPWRPSGYTVMRWRLPAAGPPLTVRVLGSGGEGVRRAALALWHGGHALSGRVLAWLTQTRGFADIEGYWSTRHLPAGPIGIAAGVRGPVPFEPVEALATRLSPPWPEVVELRALPGS
ncbi:MAG: carboxypeptidase-like regulatory domain-containing protein [Acidobacteriota bacterium]